MAVALRLMRIGKRGVPFYRIVAIDKRKKRNGRYIEKIGLYNPLTEPATIEINQKQLDLWTQRGAQISEGLAKLLKSRKTRKG